MVKGGDNMGMDWVWRLCNMTFESGVVPKFWRSAVIVSLYKGKRRGLNTRIVETLAC